MQQGGSTLTQQLVKNLYLTPERTLVRKVREGVLSLLVEARFEKEAILEAYLNEAYWGRARGISLMGLGAAARAWFGCDARELDVGEAALLAGMLRSPGGLDPARTPPRAARDVTRSWGGCTSWAGSRTRTGAPPPRRSRCSIGPRFTPRTRTYFLDALAREARRRYALEELRSRGYTLLTTLDYEDQAAGEKALRRGSRARRGDRCGGRPPGRVALDRSRVGRDPGVGRRAQLPGQSVRPRRARSPPARERVQAGHLHRRVRRMA